MSESNFNPETDLEFSIDDKVKEKFERKSRKRQRTNDNPEALPSELIKVAQSNFAEMLGEAPPNVVQAQMRAFGSQIDKVAVRVILFDYKTSYYRGMMEEVDNRIKFQIVNEFEELPKILKEEQDTVLFLNYSGYPRLCNQMIPLVKEKFGSTKIVLTAKHLTPEKVKAHRESELAVHDYLNMPFTLEDFYRVLLKYS